MYVTKNFHISELVPKEFYKQYGRLSTRAIDKRVVEIAQYLRNHFGSICVNGSYGGVEFNESGLRLPQHKTYSYGSDHARGTALDLKFYHYIEKEAYNFIMDNKEIFIPMGLTAIETNTWGEDGKGWLHISVANYEASDIVIFDAKQNGAIINREVLQ